MASVESAPPPLGIIPRNEIVCLVEELKFCLFKMENSLEQQGSLSTYFFCNAPCTLRDDVLLITEILCVFAFSKLALGISLG